MNIQTATLFKLSKPKSWAKNSNKDSFSFIDLFAGIGGFRIALEKEGGDCLYSSEINPACREVYSTNFGEYPDGDITKADYNKIPEHSVLCGGFPCQPFSISGKQKGFLDTRGTLFFNVLEIARLKNPKVIFLENVKHLKYHDSGKTLKKIIESLEEIGYKTSWEVLNVKDFGLAQNRERIIIIGHREKRFDFSKIKKKPSKKIKDILDVDSNKFEYLREEEYTILDKKYWREQKGSGLIFCGYRNKSIRTAGVRPNTIHLSRVHKQPNRIYHIEGTHPTIPSQESSGRFWIYDDNKVRKLTMNECFRLQGFPDDFEKYSNQGKSYNQIGNAVAVPMIATLIKEIRNQNLI
jgi:DNA (cytosine-5)-methyltransferase 1